MIKKYCVMLLLANFVLFILCLEKYKEDESNKVIQADRIVYQNVCKVQAINGYEHCVDVNTIDYGVISEIQNQLIEENEYETLARIVQAEAGGEDIYGKLLVANVVLNRTKNAKFPNTITEVVMQHEQGVYQFSPVGNGRYYDVVIEEETYEAIDRALSGEDNSDGALYFVARDYASDDNLYWFDHSLTRLFAYGGHEFYK